MLLPCTLSLERIQPRHHERKVQNERSKRFYKVKHALYKGDFSLSSAIKIFERLGRKTEAVALINGVNPLEVTDEMKDNADL